MDIIQLAYSGGPAVLALGAVVLVVKKDLRYFGDRLATLMTDHKECQNKREETEQIIHARVTDLSSRTARIEGKMNGYLQRGRG